MSITPPTDEELHAYADEQLAATRRRELDVYFAERPCERQKIDVIKRQSDELRNALKADDSLSFDDLKLNVKLIRTRLYKRRINNIMFAASICLAISIGAIGGSKIREYALIGKERPMADAEFTYRLLVQNYQHPAVDIESSQLPVLQSWLSHFFESPPSLPNLESFSLRLVGARLMTNELGPAAMVLYATDAGQTVIFYICSRSPVGIRKQGHRIDRDLAIRYWSETRFNLAIVTSFGYYNLHPDLIRSHSDASTTPLTSSPP
jgi:anti-sigma factor RsiW